MSVGFVCGVDPGLNGAFCVYSAPTRRVAWMTDMPTFSNEKPGRKAKVTVDIVRVSAIVDTMNMMGVEFAVIEDVQGWGRKGSVKGQSAKSAFSFGFGCGIVHAALAFARIPVETVSPAVWKLRMRVPPDVEGIREAALRDFPDDMEAFGRPSVRQRRDVFSHDRAEAAFLARYGAETIGRRTA